MDEGSEGRLWPKFLNIFKKHDPRLEEHILEASEDGEIRSEVVSILLNVLELKDTEAQEIMVPRTDIIGAEYEGGIKEVARQIITHSHSRIPVYRDTKDNILGIVHAKDIIRHLLEDETDYDLSELMRVPFFVPENTKVKKLLTEFQSGRIHMAIVQDEYGGTSGLITLEDVLEEIVGDIEDEYDAERPDEIQELENGNLIVSGRVPLYDISERLDLQLDSEHVETIGGYLSQLAGRIPAKGEFITLSGFKFTIHDGDNKQVSSILIEPINKLPE